MIERSSDGGDLTRTGVVGAGVMGRDVAALLAGAGFEVTLVDVDEDALAAAREYHESTAVDALRSAGVVAAGAVRDRIEYTTDLAALSDCGFVVEAIREDLDAKRTLLANLEVVLEPDAAVGTNTSSLTPSDVAADGAHPERVVLFHFAKPAIPRPLVEIAGDEAAGWAIERAVSVGEAIGKKPVVFDRELRANGLSRLSAAIKCAASWELLRASPAAVDRGAAALGFERGPFELVDGIGLDVHLATVDNLREPYDGRFDPPAEVEDRMAEMVADGRRGQKDDEGFFEWDGDEPEIPAAEAHDVQPVLAALVAEAHRMVADGVADRETVDEVLIRGSAGDVGPFDVEAMLGETHVREVLAERYEATGAGVFEPW